MNIFNILLIQPLANGLILFYRVLGENMGLAIIGFSLFLRLILTPLTRPYLDSMRKMREFAPDLGKLKKRHKDDKLKLAQAQADFYREKGINPGSGCLPYLLQIVVLIAFFNVFTRILSNGQDPTVGVNQLLYGPLKFSEGEVLNTQFLYLDITKPDVIDLPNTAIKIPGPILFLAAFTQLISVKVTSFQTQVEEKVAKKTAEASDDIQVAMQKSMVYTFPLFTLIIGMRFASGLALYWFVFSVTQTYFQVRSQGWGEVAKVFKKFGISGKERSK